MKREELINSKEYWTTKIQLDLFKAITQYMKKNKLSRTQLAQQLNVTKGYVSQILNGDFDHKLSKLVELSLACGMVPQLQFEGMESYVKNDGMSIEKETKFSDIESFIIYIHDGSVEKTTLIKEAVSMQELTQKYSNPTNYLIGGTSRTKTAICN